MTAQDFSQLAAEMMDELETAPLYLPSQFWREINRINMAMLWNQGIENFKRTISQNYYNWLVHKSDDPQLRRALRKSKLQSVFTPLFIGTEPDIRIQTMVHPTPVELSSEERRIYRTFVSLLWLKAQRLDRHGLARRLKEPKVGHPVKMWLRRPFRRPKPISQDLANSIIECNVICDALPNRGPKTRVAEIGAGYGRLAYVWAQTQAGQYLIFDIPPALAVAQWYLPKVLPDKKIFHFRRFDSFSEIEDELSAAHVGFFTSNQLEKFPAKFFDAMVTISTLPEMTKEQVDNFLNLFSEKARQAIYVKQWQHWKNPRDGTEMSMDDYSLPSPDWRVSLDRKDPTNPMFFNRVWQRSAA